MSIYHILGCLVDISHLSRAIQSLIPRLWHVHLRKYYCQLPAGVTLCSLLSPALVSKTTLKYIPDSTTFSQSHCYQPYLSTVTVHMSLTPYLASLCLFLTLLNIVSTQQLEGPFKNISHIISLPWSIIANYLE